MSDEIRPPAGVTSIADDIAAIARIDVVPTMLEVICRATGMGFSAVARVTDDRWTACAVRDEIQFGLTPGGELPLETTICNEIRQSGQLVVIDHVSEDDEFRGHPTPRMYGFQSYISVPIRLRNGQFFGTLCAIDPRPARVRTPHVIGMFKLFAELVALHLDAQERLRVSEAALFDERQRAELQDQFIAVLGHDLRNPLGAIRTGAHALRQQPLDPRAARIVSVIDRSAARAAGLIADVMDFARARFGGGVPITPQDDATLAAMLDEVIAEMRTTYPDRIIHSAISLDRSVVCDCGRIGQLLSNLLANALSHGDAAGPVWVRAQTTPRHFELSVTNLGPPIPALTLDRLFQPFVRAAQHDGHPSREGLGLGLYIASEIARAHGGTLNVTSTSQRTRFILRLPADRGATVKSLPGSPN